MDKAKPVIERILSQNKLEVRHEAGKTIIYDCRDTIGEAQVGDYVTVKESGDPIWRVSIVNMSRAGVIKAKPL